MRAHGLYFPSRVMDYFTALQDRSASVRAKECADRVNTEFTAMLPHLRPLRFIGSILDIGCGVAAIDPLITRKFQSRVVHLMDGTGSLARQTGYKPDTLAWADVEVGRSMVEANVVPEIKVIVHEPDPKATIPVDFIISLRSWGHHYPISVYKELALRSLKPGSGLLLDIRKGTDGAEELMAAGFTLVTRIPDPSQKCRRLLFVRAYA